MVKLVGATASIVAAAALVGCNDHSENLSVAHGRLHVHSTEITVESHSGPEAHLYADGRLQIGSDDVTLDSAGHAAVVGYFTAAKAMTQHGIDTAKAGAAVGVTAAKEVVQGLAHGDTSKIGANVERKADVVRQAAAKICDDLGTIRGLQQTLASSVESFRPYAAVSDDDVNDCRKGLTKD